jgi:hypothetical protein
MSNYDPRDHMHAGAGLGCWLVLAVAVVTVFCTALLLSTCMSYAHEAGPLVPPGVQQAQATPRVGGTPSASGSSNQPIGWNYPWACCSGMDCARSDQPKDVTETPEGYRINLTGEIIAYGDKRIKQSPDGDIHWCAHRAGIDLNKTICLFVPPKGF